MKTTKPAVILLALVLLTAATAQPAEKPAKKEISNTQIASCLVKITSGEAVLPLNEFAIDYLVRSSGVAGKAAREVLEISPDMASELIEIEEIFGVDSALGGMGIPPGATVPTRRSPTAARTTARTPTARTTPRPRTPTTTTTRTTRTPPRAPTVTSPLPSTTEQTILFRLRVGLPNDAKQAAEEFMIALIGNLRSALSGAFDQYDAKLNKQLLLASNEAIRAEKDLVQLQRELRNISGSRDLSRQANLKDISALRQKLQSDMMRGASNDVLMEATTKRILEIEVKIIEELAKDDVTIELRKIVKIHEERIKRLGNKGVPEPEIAEARENLAKARIELAKRRKELSKSAGGDLLSSLNRQLSDYSIQVTRDEAEIRSLQNQLTESEALLSKADDYELLSLKADIAKQNLEETLLWHARLGRNIRSIQPPDVTVIGAE